MYPTFTDSLCDPFAYVKSPLWINLTWYTGSMTRMSMEEYRTYFAKNKRSKYGNKKTEYNGRTYHSKKEALYAEGLDTAMHAKDEKERVVSWKPQVRYDIVVNGQKICAYILDFLVEYGDGRVEYVDVKSKGTITDVYRIKSKLMKAVLGIEITER